MLALLSAAAVAAQPVPTEVVNIPTDFDLATVTAQPPLVEVGPGIYTTDPEAYNPEDMTPNEIDGFYRGVQERRIAFHVLNLADAGTTLYCLNEVAGCTEVNPIYGGSQTAVVVGKVASAVIYEVTLDHLLDHASPDMVRLFQFVHMGILGGVVTWNATVIF